MAQDWRYEVRRGALGEGRWQAVDQAPLAAGQARLKVGLYAITANNITYGLMGEGMGYWDFFPAPEGFGVVPVWGFADVAESRAEGLAVGERVYGYLPMGESFVADVAGLRADGFVDAASHRAKRAAAYNRYARVSADPSYEAAREAQIALFRPLFTTSFVIDHYLAHASFFDAQAVVLSSASSKTAMGTAFVLRARGSARPRVIGLTARANLAFTRALDVYDAVIAYEDIETLSAAERCVFVDIAGASAVRARVHKHYGAKLAHSLVIGVTHWSEAGAPAPDDPVKPAVFFAPDQIRIASQEWGAEGFAARLAKAWRAFDRSTDAWLRIETARSHGAIEQAFKEVLNGRAPPARGHIVIPA